MLDEVGSPDLDDADIAEMQQVIVDTGALAALEAQIAALTDEAIAAIEVAPITPESRSELIALAALRQSARRLRTTTAGAAQRGEQLRRVDDVDRDLDSGCAVGLGHRQPGLADPHAGGLLQRGDICRHLWLVAAGPARWVT